MLNWDFTGMIEHCKDKPADILVAKDTGAAVTVKEEDERKWLERIEQVQSRVFHGKKYAKQKDDCNSIAEDWARADRRLGKETTVMVDGFAISKQSMSCGDWEAVPTMAGKDPRLAEPKRAKKAAVINQEHQCWDCNQKTQDAGGMIFRCRWCEKGFCEDCLDWPMTELIGDNLKEYDLLEFPAVTQAYYIRCPSCTDLQKSDAAAQDFFAKQAMEIDKQHSVWLDEQDAKVAAIDAEQNALIPEQNPLFPTPSDDLSLTDASTIDGSM
ncbi:MAG: hypothetical protein Q9224_007667, partial [Gallowayella concinna]